MSIYKTLFRTPTVADVLSKLTDIIEDLNAAADEATADIGVQQEAIRLATARKELAEDELVRAIRVAERIKELVA